MSITKVCEYTYITIFYKHLNSCFFTINLHFVTSNQAWRGRIRQARGHRLPSSIQGEWLTIDDQKNNLSASFYLASYLAVNWLQNSKQIIVFITQKLFLFLCVCVFVCVVSQFDLFITNKTTFL